MVFVFVVKILNKDGNGAGQNKYPLRDHKKVLDVSTNVPFLVLILGNCKTIAD